MKILNWKFVYSSDVDNMMLLVNDWITQGWQPLGGIAMTTFANKPMFSQGLVKYKAKDSDGDK